MRGLVTPERNDLTPLGRALIGVALTAVGGLLLALAAGAFGPPPLAHGAPPWMGYATGVVFGAAGLFVLVQAAAGAGADGMLPPTASRALRAVSWVLVLTVIGGLALMTSWVALGEGGRAFEMTAGPLTSTDVTEAYGRIWFGVGALLMWAAFALVGRRAIGDLRSRPPTAPGPATAA
jgi:hypothetical protein